MYHDFHKKIWSSTNVFNIVYVYVIFFTKILLIKLYLCSEQLLGG